MSSFVPDRTSIPGPIARGSAGRAPGLALLVLLLGLPWRPVAAQDSAELTLEPGDAVRLEFLNHPELQGEFKVGYDGTVLLPGLGFVTAEGRPFSRVEGEIRKGYGAALGDPVLRVTPLVRVLVLGQVRQPGIFTVDPTYGMMDVLSSAGGLTGIADRDRITLLRNGSIVAHLDLEARRPETRLHSGDRIMVGRVGWLRENLAVFVGALGSVAAAAVAGLILR